MYYDDEIFRQGKLPLLVYRLHVVRYFLGGLPRRFFGVASLFLFPTPLNLPIAPYTTIYTISLIILITPLQYVPNPRGRRNSVCNTFQTYRRYNEPIQSKKLLRKKRFNAIVHVLLNIVRAEPPSRFNTRQSIYFQSIVCEIYTYIYFPITHVQLSANVRVRGQLSLFAIETPLVQPAAIKACILASCESCFHYVRTRRREGGKIA